MKILFLDQSGKMGGAELSLADVATSYRDQCLVGLFAEGPYRTYLEQRQVPVRVLSTQPVEVRKDSSFWQGVISLGQLIPLISTVASLSRQYDLIYANTQKAFVVGAMASALSGRPLVYHLRDILSEEHFSNANRRLAVTLANRFAALVIANSHATRDAFIRSGGHADVVKVVYNGFDPAGYQTPAADVERLQQQLNLAGRFVIGHFSRLSPWKGQHVLIEALTHCPPEVTVLLVGDALFGETAYVEQLHRQVAQLGLQDRVQFLGFRSDIPQLMAACDLVAHTSTAPEPFGRVIIEAMLCGRPVVAAAAGGAVELIDHGRTGWLTPPGDPNKLAEIIQACYSQPDRAAKVAQQANLSAHERFDLASVNQQINQLLCHLA